MIKMIDVNERYVFKSNLDKNEPRAEFVLRPLTSMEQSKSVLKYEENLQTEAMFGVVKACLVEIRNGDKVIKDITDDVLNGLPLQFILEIYHEIMSKNVLTDTDAKN